MYTPGAPNSPVPRKKAATTDKATDPLQPFRRMEPGGNFSRPHTIRLTHAQERQIQGLVVTTGSDYSQVLRTLISIGWAAHFNGQDIETC